ncbi:NYN domain-containing protein [Nocardioides pantholopis]|uniref:NYN domain-containing protein n=1 Tax=Nocardioides pantholopis TaxID=2483798 RepID=UPI000F081108|nr:NYN domain-containing protein [Nocardioides pantholopis]
MPLTDPTTRAVRLAVLIDADNTSGKHASALLAEVARYGVPTVKRAYGDWTTTRLGSWKDELNRNAIQPVQQFSYTTGKNSTDSALIIDAMDLLYTGNLDAFALVSSDSDFTRLATRLRESGKTVYGFGRRRTPEALVAACDRFVFLEVLGTDAAAAEPVADTNDPDDPEDPAGTEAAAAPLPDLREILTAAVDNTSAEDGWALLGSVGSYLNTRHASFDPRNYGFGKLISLARAQDYLELAHEDGNAPRVRLKPVKVPPKVTTRRRTAKKAATD